MARMRLTWSQRIELFKLWRDGHSQSAVARALDWSQCGVRHTLMQTGGFSPVERRRSARQLNVDEREAISRLLAAGLSIRGIARELGRAPSSVSREIKRNGGCKAYRAVSAEKRAWQCAKRPKACKLSANKHLRDLVASKLSKQWSPEQIAGWLAKRYPLDFAMQISHETIYKSLYVQARGVLKRELLKNLRTRRSFRHSRTSTDDGQGRGQIVDAVNISERPAEVEDRAIPGHWEGDLITGRRDTHIVTLVERQSRYVLLVKIPNKEAATVALALQKAIKTMPRQLRKSLTWDRGSEMAHHKDISLASKIEVYFCDPQSPWQRGSNENTNGLLRQYLPKGSDLSVHSQAQLNAIARRLNERPRMTLDFQTPAEVYSKAVALID